MHSAWRLIFEKNGRINYMNNKFREGPFRSSFEDRYNHFAFPEPNSGCFIWMGALSHNGYGMMAVSGANKKVVYAHRAAYEHFIGPIPDGLDLDHKCRMRCCVNPDHLEPVTRKENLRRGVRKSLQTHCKFGHLLSGKNLVPDKKGRRCRICQYARIEKYKERNRG